MRDVKFDLIYQGETGFHHKKYYLSELMGGINKICDIHHMMKLVAKRQYTKLKDKNGVEIYEGDIVTIQYDHDQPTIHEVVWCGIDYPAFDFQPQLNCECNGFSHYHNDPDTIVEVIGNIYENPEILGENK